ncbi:MAG: hypothetical protein EB010_10485 [Acidimicrobiia bacterium]|nr:hypothetical protein [Actinomycetota bacterium]NDE59830.1 hypothetical protein [Acidimicrobiia bacterium]
MKEIFFCELFFFYSFSCFIRTCRIHTFIFLPLVFIPSFSFFFCWGEVCVGPFFGDICFIVQVIFFGELFFFYLFS